MERENKLLRLKLYEMQEKVESRRPRPVSTADTDTRQLQHEILVRNMVRSIILSKLMLLKIIVITLSLAGVT